MTSDIMERAKEGRELAREQESLDLTIEDVEEITGAGGDMLKIIMNAYYAGLATGKNFKK